MVKIRQSYHREQRPPACHSRPGRVSPCLSFSYMWEQSCPSSVFVRTISGTQTVQPMAFKSQTHLSLGRGVWPGGGVATGKIQG